MAFSVSPGRVWGCGFDSGGRSVQIGVVVMELIWIGSGFGCRILRAKAEHGKVSGNAGPCDFESPNGGGGWFMVESALGGNCVDKIVLLLSKEDVVSKDAGASESVSSLGFRTIELAMYGPSPMAFIIKK